ncbi:MAG TPA: peptidylprolyl isomerase [Flavisolibacter sp.]|jgi:peptidyl-prolyl cis-trans isomerase SurA|nr:peptidylprolyl isomerase [Flavisolibacter sp.]
MKKLLTALSLAAAFAAPAQTLFTYGKEAVSAPDFLVAFQKANQGPVTDKALKEYLDLYIASRLKIKEAKDLGYDTLPQLAADLASLRQQIIPSYITDKETMNRMVAEAFARAQKDLRVAHIFIRLGGDSKAAEQKKEAVAQALRKGDFANVAKTYSDDPNAKANGGNLGWITAFSLPYELENLAYSTPVGQVSPVYQSGAGYHFFKVIDSRKAMGRVKAAQILLAIPPNSSEATKAALKRKADSLYKRLLAGDDFGKLATAFSNDVVSAASNGQMAEFGVGEYEPAFEQAVLALKDGAFSKPFTTAHGYHIVKRIKLDPVPATLTPEVEAMLLNRIQESDRSEFAKRQLAQKVAKQTGYKKLLVEDAQLWAYTDSVFSYQAPKIKVTLQPTTGLLHLGDRTATVNDWMAFVQPNRFKRDGSSAKPYPQLWNEFVSETALNYYQDHLEDFNEEFRRQIAEFAEGNLFFEIMQRQVWTPAQTDSAALAAYFQQHQNNYHWKESADAVVFYASTETAAKEFYNALRKKPSDWQSLLLNFPDQITADSNRFELNQLPQSGAQKLSAGTLTAPVVNNTDQSAMFAYILKLYSDPEPRSFEQAKGLVINDYQTKLEKEWIEKLKKKYPVSVDEKVWNEVVQQVKR